MSGGAHIVIGRDDAKRLFAQQNDADLRRVVHEIRHSPKYRSADLVLECGELWNPLHRMLTDGTLDPQGGEFPLDHCVLGGKRLHQGREFEAVLIRPDIVPLVAEALHHMKRAEMLTRYLAVDPADYGRPLSEAEFDRVWQQATQIRQLFEDAAADRDAVLFTVEP